MEQDIPKSSKNVPAIAKYAFYLSIFLTLVKLGAYFITHANTVLLDAIENGVNVITALFALYSIHLAQSPKDKNHPYGHGKVEFFVFFIEGALILIMGISLIAKSIYNIFIPQTIHSLDWGILIITGTIILNWLFGYLLVRESKKTKIITLQAEGKHLILDAITSLAIVVGLIIIYFTKFYLFDAILSIAIGGHVVYQGVKIFKKAVSGLMDETDFKLVEKLASVLENNKSDRWIDLHNFRILSHGSFFHVDCHLTLPYYFSIEEAHAEVYKLEKLINRNYAHEVDVFVHIDPCTQDCCKYCAIADCQFRAEVFDEKQEWTIERLISETRDI